MQCRCLYHTSICIFSMSHERLMYLSRATLMHLITATSWAIMPSSYIGKMATILWLQPQWAHRDKIPQCCNSTWKPMSKSSPVIKRYGNRYSDKLYPNTCCLFLDAYCVDKHQILRKSYKFHKFLLDSHGIFRKISYLCPRIEAFFAYCKIQKRAEVRSFPNCYLYNIGKRPTSWFSIKVQFRASYIC